MILEHVPMMYLTDFHPPAFPVEVRGGSCSIETVECVTFSIPVSFSPFL